MDYVFNSGEDGKPEDTELRNIDDVVCKVVLQNKIKDETSETQLDTYANKDDAYKIIVKSEANGLECESSFDNDSIKLELLHEELDIKPDILVHHEEQTSDLHQLKPLHLEENTFKCMMCSYGSMRKHNLKQHQNIHTSEKPFKCTVCSYASKQQCYLKMHMKKHTGEKPFKCSICSYATVRKGSLDMHVRTHTGEKPFKGSVCSYATVGKNI